MTDPNEREHPTLEDEIFGATPASEEIVGARPAGDAADVERAPDTRPSEGRGRPALPRPLTGDGPGCRDIAVTIMGFVTFVLVDCVMMYAPFRMKDAPSLVPQMLTLLLLAFGLGGMLVWHIRGGWRPFGIGMMLGWLFMTLVSAGFLTGLNP